MRAMVLAAWGLMAFLACSSAIPASGLSPADRKAVARILDREAKALREEGRENRGARRLAEVRFRRSDKPDVFAFLTLERTDANNYGTYLFLLSDAGRGYEVVASSPVGSGMQRIEPGRVEVFEGDILLRSDVMADIDNMNDYGAAKVYCRWRVQGKDLKQVGNVWLKKGTTWKEAKKK
jgi:hypothetical protein